MQVSDHLVVRPVTVIRILGGILGGLISIPYLIGMLYFFFQSIESHREPVGSFDCLGFLCAGLMVDLSMGYHLRDCEHGENCFEGMAQVNYLVVD